MRLDSLQLYIPPFSFGTKYPLPQTLATGGTGVIIDSGSSSIALPPNITQAIYTQLSVTPDTSLGITLNKVDCGLRGSSGFLSFGLNDTVISIAMRELVMDGASIGKDGSCYLLLYPNDIPLLGAPFLRSAYGESPLSPGPCIDIVDGLWKCQMLIEPMRLAIFNWDTQDIHIARSADCGTDIQALEAGDEAMNGIVGNCFPSPKKVKLNAPVRRRW